jgi:hypothetical protein
VQEQQKEEEEEEEEEEELTTEALTMSPGLKLSYILTRSFSVARTSCTRMTPCHSASRTVSPHTRMAATACLGVILVTLHRTTLPTCGRTSRCFLPPAAATTPCLETDTVGSCPAVAPAALDDGRFWVILEMRLAGPWPAAAAEEEDRWGGWVMLTVPRTELYRFDS